MSDAIDNAAVMLYAVSERYKESGNCRLEVSHNHAIAHRHCSDSRVHDSIVDHLLGELRAPARSGVSAPILAPIALELGGTQCGFVSQWIEIDLLRCKSQYDSVARGGGVQAQRLVGPNYGYGGLHGCLGLRKCATNVLDACAYNHRYTHVLQLLRNRERR